MNMSETKSLVPMNALRKLLLEAYYEGFMSSGERWNGGYPFEQDATPDWFKYVQRNFEEWFAGPKDSKQQDQEKTTTLEGAKMMTGPQNGIKSKYTAISDKIIWELMSNDDPVAGIMYLYDNADDKKLFVAALATTLLLRHRQWQAGAGRG